ncbi:DUF5681 domain-containing protein [Mesorhizobium sp. B2-5-7]|uniref:DUF5681 domain-containing protein n=1 Tax=Mesorhizobium sp. B2-5-7 TaxID=2589923 RepID=UPI001125E5B5|nr:DUF5681 domain-containing protein [Mesorhizobium sp. B2-5-7]TPK07388.1 hypothetical protein FJ543_27900 [Mesorhizobium sp. B2-5-7]
MDKKVGFKNPPVKYRFKKGQSGNARGRPPKVKNASTLLAMELDKLIVVRENGRETKITKREALVISLVNDAIAGKNQARALLVKIIDVSTPVDPFVRTAEDDAAFRAFIGQFAKPIEPEFLEPELQHREEVDGDGHDRAD